MDRQTCPSNPTPVGGGPALAATTGSVQTTITFNCNGHSAASQQMAVQSKRKEKARIAARARRSQEAHIIMEMANELEIKQEKMRRIDKTTIIKLAIDYIRAVEVLCQHRKEVVDEEEPRQQQQQVPQAASVGQPTIRSTHLQNMNDCQKLANKNNNNNNKNINIIDTKTQRQQTRRNNKINIINQDQNYQRELISSDEEEERHDLYGRCLEVDPRDFAANDENVNTSSGHQYHHHKNNNNNNINENINIYNNNDNNINVNTNYHHHHHHNSSLLHQIHKSRRIENEDSPLTMNTEHKTVLHQQQREEDFYSAKQLAYPPPLQEEQIIERPNITTASIFEPKTIDNMNDHYLMIKETDNGKAAAFVWKLDEDIHDQDDLTHLAPQAGDVHIPLDAEPLDNIVLDFYKTNSSFVSLSSTTCD